jgi:uncharacterized protein (TIGR02246 family)
MTLRTTIPVFVCLLLSATSAKSDPQSDDNAIRQRFAAWTAAFNARDARGACDIFAPDLAYSVPGVPAGTQQTMCGTLAKLFTKPGIKLSYAPPDIHGIIVSGDIAVVRLTWTLTTEADGRIEKGVEHGIDIFRRQPDDRWSIAEFIAFTE